MSNTGLFLDAGNTRVIVDSSSNVPTVLQEQYRLLEVPALISFGADSYRNKIDLSEAEFYRRLAAGTTIPTTSQPPPSAFADVYRQAFAEGAEQIVVVTITQKLSGTFASAQLATQEFDPARFLVWDGNSISIGSGWQAVVVARLLHEGIDRDALIAMLTRVRSAVRGFATLDTLTYAALSGRISNLQAGIGNLLQVKAILDIVDGQVATVGRVRGRKRALSETVARFTAHFGEQPVCVGIQHADALADAQGVAEELAAMADVRELHIGDIGPAIASLGGPGAVGVIGFPAILAERG